jgi:hypothetical protein
MGAAAVMGGAMDNLLNNNTSHPDPSRRASTPNTSSTGGGGFSSIFNLKSVINAATKTQAPNPQPAPSTSNFYVSSPPVATEPITVDLHSQSHTTAPQKSVQGILLCLRWLPFFCFVFVVLVFYFTFSVCLLMKYCFN